MMLNGANHYPHRIRLRGPWQYQTVSRAEQAACLPTVTMPCRFRDISLTKSRDTVRFVRKFGYPGHIDESEHVWLTCQGVGGLREVRLNGHLVSQLPCETFAFDVTPLLADRNRLEVLIHPDSDDAGLWGEVALEIRKDAYLTDVHLHQTKEDGLRIIGKVMGTSPQPLELYTLVDDQHTDYRTIQPTPDGQAFQVDLPGLSAARHTVRVELIHISCIWDVIELIVT